MDAVVDDIAAGAQVALNNWIHLDLGATGDTFNIWWVGDHIVDPASNYLLLANTNIAFANSDRFTTATFEVV